MPSERDDALAILRRLREHGHVAYFAGGCVRDLLLGLEPKDYDIATDAPPPRVRELFTNTQAVGAAFGVILVRHGKSIIEVATFRSDVSYEDGRHPTAVRFTTAEEDAKRRDFTINGLFYDPIENKVIDYVGGEADLMAKILRAIGDPNHRFEEDHLRMLRAIRFAARFNLAIESATADAIARHAEHLKRVSPERIGEELRLMLTPPTRLSAWKFLWDFKLMQVLFRHLPEHPEYPENQEFEAPLYPALAPGAEIPFGLSLAAMALCYRAAGHSTPWQLLRRQRVRETVAACRTALKISNDESAMMEACLELEPLLRDNPPTTAQLKRFLARPFSAEARLMIQAIGRVIVGGDRLRIEWLEKQFGELEKTDYAPAPFVTGDDLTAAGLSPGPIFKRVLDAVYDAQLEDRVKTKDEAMKLAMSLAV